MIDAISTFGQKSLSYTYENNGGSFTNFFDGHTRISELESRGTLHAVVSVIEVADGVYFLTWEDEEMGALTQLIDLPGKRIFATVLWKEKMEIWPAVITEFC
ncbi:MAG: hypothetical protein ACI845_003791 [Gammaproteobacteria bacterium]|jgi:hypothetical protein